MPIQEDIEGALVTLVETALPAFTMSTGPSSGPKLSGNARRGTVRLASGESDRLAYGQNDWSEFYEIILLWSPTIDRDDRIAEFALVQSALLADQFLGGSITGLSDSWLSSFAWGEPIDAEAITCVALVAVRRIE